MMIRKKNIVLMLSHTLIVILSYPAHALPISLPLMTVVYAYLYCIKIFPLPIRHFSSTFMEIPIIWLSAQMNKSLQWIHGNFMHYLLRPHQKVVVLREQRIKIVVDSWAPRITHQEADNSSIKGLNSSIIGVHVRGGLLDNHRHAAHTSHYVNATDIISNQLAALGRPVDSGFICGEFPEENFILCRTYDQEIFPILEIYSITT